MRNIIYAYKWRFDGNIICKWACLWDSHLAMFVYQIHNVINVRNRSNRWYEESTVTTIIQNWMVQTILEKHFFCGCETWPDSCIYIYICWRTIFHGTLLNNKRVIYQHIPIDIYRPMYPIMSPSKENVCLQSLACVRDYSHAPTHTHTVISLYRTW